MILPPISLVAAFVLNQHVQMQNNAYIIHTIQKTAIIPHFCQIK